MAQLTGRFLKSTIAKKEGASGDGSTVNFALSSVPISSAWVDVYVDGIYQREGGANDYTIAGLTITFNTAPALGQRVDVKYFTKD